MFAKKGWGATKELQSKRRRVFVLCSSRYLSANMLEKFVGKVVHVV